LESENPKKEIAMYINSPGGMVTSPASRSTTPCNTSAARFPRSAWAWRPRWARCCCAPAKRAAHRAAERPHHGSPALGRFPWPGVRHQRHAEDIIATKRRLNEIYVKHTGQPYEEVERTFDRDHFMTAEEAKAFGIVDRVYEKRELPEGGLSGAAYARCNTWPTASHSARTKSVCKHKVQAAKRIS
jgi:ATP-dependent Clp protease protease subunit